MNTNTETTNECPACEWGEELVNHHHDEAEDPDRSECCEHNHE